MTGSAPIRVLVVDDAVVVRRMLSDVLAGDPSIEVVGTAASGRIALQKLTQVNPDLVTLDVEMPDMDGLATLKAIRATHPRLPVIMFSTVTARGAAATLDALAAGASDYATKPANAASIAAAQQWIREELLPKIKALCPPRLPAVAGPVRPAPAPPAMARATGGWPSEIDIVAIGVSTGGPNALAEVLPAIGLEFPVPVVVVQHMPPTFTKLLADRLDSQCRLRVIEAAGGEPLEAGTVYVAPGNFHMTVQRMGTRTVTALNHDAPENSCRPAVDVLFRSVAGVFGGRALGVVLTGMGQDGLRGCEALRREGARIIVQDEASSVVWGMPGFVARAGLADRVLPLGAIAGEIALRVAARRRRLGAAC